MFVIQTCIRAHRGAITPATAVARQTLVGSAHLGAHSRPKAPAPPPVRGLEAVQETLRAAILARSMDRLILTLVPAIVVARSQVPAAHHARQGTAMMMVMIFAWLLPHALVGARLIAKTIGAKQPSNAHRVTALIAQITAVKLPPTVTMDLFIIPRPIVVKHHRYAPGDSLNQTTTARLIRIATATLRSTPPLTAAKVYSALITMTRYAMSVSQSRA